MQIRAIGKVFILASFMMSLQHCKTKTPENTGSEADAATSATDAASGASSAFQYKPAEPVSGKMKGVVELGATGFNSFVINVDADKNWKQVSADYGSGLVYENLATDQDIKDGLKNYISKMIDQGVSGKDIHFVISSSAKKAAVMDKITAELKKKGYVVNAVTAEEEGIYALNCVLPTSYADKAFVVDIGSGNTKISWKTGSETKAVETHGSKYFQDAAKTDDIVAKEVSAASKQVASSNTSTCFIIGGVPFELAKSVRNGDERYTVLKAPGDYTPENEKQKCGINIYKSIAEATGCKEFVFDWHANFTIGFLLGQK